MKKKKNGFTLLEMIIVVMLAVVVVGITTSVFITGNKVFSDSDVKSTLQMEGQAIQENISKLGMESIGIENIKDQSGKEIITSSHKDIKIVNASYKELESKLTDINGNNGNPLNNEWLSISEMEMNFYREENNGDISVGTPITIIKFEKDRKRLSTVDGKELSTNVESVRIKPIDIGNKAGTFQGTNSFSINIILSKKKGYSNVTYPISIDVTLRNNFIK